MATSREGPNPLRPYYIPPSVGSPPDVPPYGATAPNISNRNAPTSTANFGSSARNILSDMDYSDYLAADSPSPPDVVKRLVEQALWKYTSVLLAQPFEVAKTILQVNIGIQKSSVKDAPKEESRRRLDIYENLSDDDSDDSPSYFTSSAPLAHTPSRHSRPRRRRRQSPSPDGIPRVHTPQPPPSKPRTAHTLDLKSASSILSCLSTLWTTEGAWGVWKGTNSTYIYSLLLSTTSSFIRSFFSAFLALPDPGLSFSSSATAFTAGGLDVLSSPAPLASLFVSVSAAGLASILLAPLDIARTKLILTPSTHPPRSVIATLNTLPTWTIPLSLAPTAILHSTLPTLMSASTPLVLRNRLGIDPLLTPTLYNIGTFAAQVAELVVKLPIETVLRRGQMAVARETPKGREMPTIVELGPYKGLFGTMRSIIYEEGESGGTSPQELKKGIKGAAGLQVSKEKRRKGQGVEGLWRGWRVGMWGLVGVWGAATLGGVGGKSGEF